ncbi:MAG: hypothetical protein E7H33_09335 [Clostridium perfringens]|nr:hypothetical protein [Clostridium perfringens]
MNGEVLKRIEGETDFEFGLRLIKAKMEKTLDLDWDEIIELTNSNCHRDSLRKAASVTQFSAYNVIKYFEDKINQIKIKSGNSEDIEELLEDLKEKQRELKKERIRLQTEKIEYNKWLRTDTRNEMFFDSMKDSIKKIEVPEFNHIKVKNNSKVGLLGFSDFHFGKIFSSINNQYSEEIFYERMNKLSSEVVELCKEQGITKLHILNCGDDVEGMTLRISQLKSLEHGFTDQVIKLARYLAKFLNKLSEDLEIVYHHVLTGNHSELRAFGDKTFTFENMERIIISYIRDVLENNKRVEVPEYNGKFVDFKIFDYNIYAQHGQKVRNPKRVIADVSQQLRKFIDVAYFGHLHHEQQFTTNEAPTHDCEVVYIPSIIGSDEYCDDNFFGGAKSSAKLDIYEDGKCRKGSFKIILN